jgi:hypothetical protein
MRRSIFVFIVICGQLMPVNAKLILMLIVQALNFIYFVIVRPFEKIVDNLIEVVNDIYFIILLGVLFTLKDKSDWTLGNEKLYLMGK